MIGRVLAISLVSLLGSTTVAFGAEWSRPETVVASPAGDTPVDSGFLTSPNGRRSELVVLRKGIGITLYPWQARSRRFGPGALVPRSANAEDMSQAPFPKGEYPNAAIDDKGLVAIAWLETQGEGEGFNECFCAVRAVVLGPDARFGAVHAITRPTGQQKEVLGLALTPSGQANILWSQGRRVKLTSTPIAEHSIRSQTIDPPRAPAIEDYEDLLSEEDDKPVVIYRDSPDAPMYLTRPPFIAATPIGVPPWSLEGDDIFLGNRSGDDLAFSTEIGSGSLLGAYRQSGHSFGPIKRIASLKAPAAYPNCELNAAVGTDEDVLVAWACNSSSTESGGPTSFAQAALFNSTGRLLALSPQRRGGVLAGEPPGVALGADGQGLVALQASNEGNPWAGIMGLTVNHKHFGHWRTVVKLPMEDETTVSAAITANGTGLVTWPESTSAAITRVRLAETQLTH